MNILFLYISLPELSSSSVFTDLIREFALKGHNVTVATPAKTGMEIGLHKECDIDVLRFKTDQLTANSSNVQKGIAYIKLIFQYLNAIKKYFSKRRFDIIIGHSLPPELGLIIPKLKKYYNAKFYLQLCEFIWQDSVAMGFFSKKSVICKYYNWLEDRLIKSADYIGCPSQGNIDFALKYHPWAESTKEMHVLQYCQYPVVLSNTKNVDFRKKHNWEGKFVAIYGGSINIAQRIENVIHLAESCLGYEDIVFVIIGRGSQFDVIKQDICKRQIHNITFMDYMPKDEYNELLSQCDVGIVSLNPKLQMPNIPSKTLGLFNLSKPILAAIDYSTDYGKFLENAGAGLWSYSGDTDSFKKNLIKLYNDRALLTQMGHNGHEYYLNNLTPDKAYKTIMDHIK